MNVNKINKLFPPATIGVIGGGQLGRMFVFEAKRMGYHVIVLDPKPNSPAGQVADEQIVAGFDDISAYFELAKKTDVITFEFEHINAKILESLENSGYRVVPSSRTLGVIQNKFNQKTMLKRIGVNVPEFSEVNNLDELTNLFQYLDQKAILKSSFNGYDGKGNIVIKSKIELEPAYQMFSGEEVFIEELIDFTKEVSIVVVKNDTEVSFYPVVENVHQNSILIKTLVPARLTDDVLKKIHDTSLMIVEELDDYGVFCIEFFVDNDSEIIVNEIAPRPHNSGHYTIEGCITSQYEQLVRIVCGMPLGSTHLRQPCAMYNILGNEESKGKYSVSGLDSLFSIKDCHCHIYGKPDTNNLKKIGHITILGETVEEAEDKGRIALNSIRLKGE
ncbi:MAG: 5-(carboxyamino)imidazole ribonucleotide synthase [Clostridiales bacterium]|nr:5-(carboxyamino)imidazole ribonucleotide synthase [Clostridiales bacterium]